MSWFFLKGLMKCIKITVEPKSGYLDLKVTMHQSESQEYLTAAWRLYMMNLRKVFCV